MAFIPVEPAGIGLDVSKYPKIFYNLGSAGEGFVDSFSASPRSLVSASTTDAGNRMARPLPHFETYMINSSRICVMEMHIIILCKP